MVNAHIVNTFSPSSFSDLETTGTDFCFKWATRLPARAMCISRISWQPLVSERFLRARNAEMEKSHSLQRLMRRANDSAMEIYFS